MRKIPILFLIPLLAVTACGTRSSHNADRRPATRLDVAAPDTATSHATPESADDPDLAAAEAVARTYIERLLTFDTSDPEPALRAAAELSTPEWAAAVREVIVGFTT